MKKYNVLWLEDEPEKFPTFVEECREDYGILLHQCGTRAEGISQLEKHSDMWDAILLDAKMPEQFENAVATIDGLRSVMEAIYRACSKRNIPYFISTGQPDLLSNEMFKQAYGEYYRKGTDDVKLMEDIVKAIEGSPKQQVKNIYHHFFSALENIGIDSEAEDIALAVLLPMHYPNEYPHFSPKLHYNQLRHFLEFLFRACGKLGIIPEFCVKDTKGKVNLNQCSIYLAGKECDVLNIKYGTSKDDRIIPQHIETIIRSVLEFGNIHSHTADLDESDQKLVEKILESANSHLLVFGFTFQLMEVVSWFDELVHDINSGRKTLLEYTKIVSPEYVTKYSGKSFIPERDDEGYWHCGECSVIIRPWHKTQIVLKSIMPNENEQTKDKYPYFATYILK